ncbi:MAG TPA: hypothetical protein VGG32_05500 [Thermoplasmata archaeon]|jgi:hypothetical protein
MEEKSEGLNRWRKLAADEQRLGLGGLDFDTYVTRRSQLPDEEKRRLDDDFKDVSRDFAEQHFRLFKATCLQWTHDPRTVRILADPRLKELPRGQLSGPLLHACSHLGEETRARAAAGETIPQPVLLGIGVVMGWYARAAVGRIGLQDHIAKGGRVGPEPKIDADTQSQVWLWHHDGASLNIIRRRLTSRQISVTRAGIRVAIERENERRKTSPKKTVN